MSQNIVLGLPDEWKAFEQRQQVFVEKLPLLRQTFEKVFIRQMQISNSQEKVVFFLGRLCVEDFMEILLLCGNGYGIGALKLLRGLFERSVTLGYIAENPEEADNFLEYHHIHVGKHFNHANEVLSMSEHLPQEKIDQIKDAYLESKKKYQEEACEKCHTTKLRFSWSSIDLPGMAKKVGLKDLYLQCYYEPMLQAHPTVSSLIARLKPSSDGKITFNEGAQRESADSALIGAHSLILSVLMSENKFFRIGLDDELNDRLKDFKLIWKKDSKE
jgi:hypothetical protein